MFDFACEAKWFEEEKLKGCKNKKFFISSPSTGEKEKKKARQGRWEGEREEERPFSAFFLFLMSPARGYISIIVIFFGIPSGSTSEVERESFLKHFSS